MLRRKPTAITLTSEDIATYEDHRLASLDRKENTKASEYLNNLSTPAKKGESAKVDPNDELKPLPGDRARVRGGGVSREERILGR